MISVCSGSRAVVLYPSVQYNNNNILNSTPRNMQHQQTVNGYSSLDIGHHVSRFARHIFFDSYMCGKNGYFQYSSLNNMPVHE